MLKIMDAGSLTGIVGHEVRMKYVVACFFAVIAVLALSRAVSGLTSGAVTLKLYLPTATRSQRPALYWTLLCGNLLVFAVFVSAAAYMVLRAQ